MLTTIMSFLSAPGGLPLTAPAQTAPQLFFRSPANANRKPSPVADRRQIAGSRTLFRRPAGLAIGDNAPHTQRRIFAQLESLLMIDELTGLLNHRSFTHSLNFALTRAERSETGGSLIHLELAGTELAKHHDAAHHAMQEVAALLRQISRKSGFAARLPGYRFGLILPETSLDLAQRQVAGLRLAIEQSEISFNGVRLDLDAKFRVLPLTQAAGALTHSRTQPESRLPEPSVAGASALLPRRAARLALVR